MIMMNKSVAIFVAIAAMAIAVPAAQAKLVVHVGVRCQYWYATSHSTGGSGYAEVPPKVCGVNAQEVVVGTAGNFGGSFVSLGFKTSKHVRLGLSIVAPGSGDGFVSLEKRTKDGKYFAPSGPMIGSFIRPNLDPLGSGSERFDLSSGSYKILISLTSVTYPFVAIPFVLTITATPSGYVTPYTTGLDA